MMMNRTKKTESDDAVVVKEVEEGDLVDSGKTLSHKPRRWRQKERTRKKPNFPAENATTKRRAKRCVAVENKLSEASSCR